jgi:4-amino-4-deoxy-L-arabinose transferase-like glycosyltransferase
MRVQRRIPASLPVGLVLALVAFAARAELIRETRGLPEFRTLAAAMDASVTWEAARQLRGQVIVSPSLELSAQSAPLHVRWLALGQSLLGESIVAHRWLSAVLGALRFLLIGWLLVRISARPWAALVAGLLVATLPSLVFFDTAVLKTGLDLTLLTGLLGVTLAAEDVQRGRWLLALGAACGVMLALALLSQLATFLYAAGVVVFALLHRAWSHRQKLAFLVPVAAVLVPTLLAFQVWQRHASPSGVYLPRAGVDMRIGWHDGATGYYDRVPGIPGFPIGHALGARLLAEAEAGRRLTPYEAHAHHAAVAGRFVLEHPRAAAAIAAQKIGFFFNNTELMAEDYLPHLAQQAAILRVIPVGYGWLVVLGAIGVVATARRPERQRLGLLAGVGVAVLVACCLTIVTWRFRAPAIVPLAALAAEGLVTIGEVLRRRCRRDLAWLVPAAIGAVAAFSPPPSATHPKMMTYARENAGTIARVEEAQARLSALETRPAQTRDERLARARLLDGAGRYSEAFAELRTVARMEPPDGWALSELLRYLLWTGDYEEAARFLDGLRARHPRIYSTLTTEQRPHLRYVLEHFVLPATADAARVQMSGEGPEQAVGAPESQ